ASGAERGPEESREPAVLRLRRGRASLGLCQPGSHRVHRVLWDPQASLAGDLVALATALAEGAEVNCSVAEEEGRTALIAAAGSLLACEFLLQNGANVNHRDLRGRGALHAAATAGHTG
ncbi:hypothetical protein XENOCAPTIV_016251, partial [Xenoophorus captivus]